MDQMNNVEGMALGIVAVVCAVSTLLNFGMLTLMVKLYTEFSKERFKGKGPN